jgi:hypothetical protein
MPNYILLLRQPPKMLKDLSPEEFQKKIAQYAAWRDELVTRGKMRGGEKLANEAGRQIRVENGRVSVTEGPFSEAQEILGGFFMIESADYDEAVAIARTCPHLVDRQWIEVLQVDPRRG